MARAFRFRITSEGVTELQAQLRALGPAGEEAFRKITNASPALRDAFDDAKKKAGEAGEAFRRSQRDITDFGGGVQIAKYQMANLYAQVQDIYVSLASGQSPFSVMTQQVPQAATAVGGMSNLLRIMAAQITPLRVGLVATGATIAALGLQAAALAGEQRALDVAIKGSGRSAELAAGQFRTLVEEMRDQGVAAADARKSIEELIRTPGLSSSLVAPLAKLTPGYAAGLGVEAPKAAEALGKAFADGAEGVKKLDEQLNFLSAAEARNIRDMAEHGRTAEALDVAVDALGRRFAGLASEALGPAERALNKLGREYTSLVQGILGSETAISIVKELADAMEGANRGWRAILNAPVEHKIVTLNAQLEQAKENLAKFEAAGPPTLLGVPVGEEAYNKSLQERRRIVTDLQQQVDGLIAQQRALASATASATAATGVNTKALKDSIPEIERQQKAADEYAQKAQDALAVAQARGVEQAKIRARQEAEEYISKNKITDATIRANIVREKENELVGKYLAQEAHKGIEKAAREAEQAEKQHAEALRQANEAAGRQIEQYAQAEEQVDKRIKGLTDENEILRLLATGYDENSVAVTALKTAKAQAAIESERSIALSKAAADANDKEAKSVEELAKGNVDAAIKLHDLAQEILTVKIPGINAKYDAEAAAAAENQRLKAMSDTNKEVARNFERVLNEANRNIADVFYQAFTGKIGGVGDFLKNIFFRQLSQGLAEAFSPITAQVLGIFVPGQRQYALRQATALSAGGGGGGGLFGGGGFGGGNLFGGIDALASEYLPGVFQAPQSLAATASQYGVNLADVAGLPTTTPGFLPFAASDALPFIGATLPGLISGNYAQAATGLAGAGIGFALGGPPGAAIGGFLGNLVGGLFGGKKKTPAAGALIDIATGDLETKSKVMSADEVARLAQSFLPSVRQTASHYGLDLAAGTRVGVGYSEGAGYDLKLVGPGEGAYLKQFALDQQNPAEALADLTLAMVQMADAVQSADLKAAAATLTFEDTAETINKVLEGALNFNKGLGPLADQLIALDAAAQAVSKAALDKVQAYLDIGTRIGGEAGKAAVQVSRDYLDTLLGLKDAAPVLSEAAAAFAQAKQSIADLTPALEEVGYTADEIAARQSVATEALTRRTRDAFYRNLAARANPALGQIDQLVAQHTADLNDAAALFGAGASSGTDAANSAFATAVDSFLKSLQPDALAGVLVDVATKADSASQYIARAAGALVQAGQAAQALSLSSPTNFDPGSALGRLAGILAQADPTGAKRSLGYLDRGDAFVDLINQVGRNPTIEGVANLDARLNLFGDRLQNGLPGSRSIAQRMQSIAQQAAQAAEGGSLFKATNDNGAGVLASFGHSRAEYLGALRRLTGVRRLSETTDISDLSEQEIVDAITAQRDVMMQAHLAGAGVLGGVVASTRGVRDVDQRFAAGRSGTDFLSAATSLRDAEAEGRRQRERQLTVAQRQLGANEQAVRLLGEIAELIRTQPQALANLLNTVRSSADAPYRSTPNGLKWGA